MDVLETPLAQSQNLTTKESNVVSLLMNTSNSTPTIPDILILTQCQVLMIAELNDAMPTPLIPPNPSKVNKLDVSLKSTITTHIGPSFVPAGSHSASFKVLLTYPMMTPTALGLMWRMDCGSIAIYVIHISRVSRTDLLLLGSGKNIFSHLHIGHDCSQWTTVYSYGKSRKWARCVYTSSMHFCLFQYWNQYCWSWFFMI